jgi:hypothetical protein
MRLYANLTQVEITTEDYVAFAATRIKNLFAKPVTQPVHYLGFPFAVYKSDRAEVLVQEQ